VYLRGKDMFGILSNDPLFSFVRDLGYNTVRLPKSTIRPLQLLTKKGDYFTRQGELSTVFTPGKVDFPHVTQDAPIPKIAAQKTANISGGAGLMFLGGLISAFGGSTDGLEAQTNGISSTSFQYEAVTEDSVEVAQLDQFLSVADIRPFSKYSVDLLESDNLYAITATLKSNKFTVYVQAQKGITLNLAVPVLQNIVGPNIKLSSKKEDANALSFEGVVPMTFGFQAVQIFYRNGKYSTLKPADTKSVMLGPAKKKNPMLITDEPFVHVEE
jgi:hypothetical protein